MSTRYCRGGCGTLMYQLRPSLSTGMSRIGVSEVLVVSRLVTSESRMMSLAPYQSCLSAASARWTDWAEMSHITCSQYGSLTARMMRSLACGPLGRGAGNSLGGDGFAGGVSALPAAREAGLV